VDKINLTSPAQVKNILRENQISYRKKWGQNFLIDQNTVDKILSQVNANPSDFIIEIGPGLGVLSLPLAQSGANLIAIEIDKGLVRILKKFLYDYPNVTLLESDIRKTNLAELASEFWYKLPPTKIVANLPYYLTSPIIYRIIGEELPWQKAVLMVQKEVANRMVARVGSPDYGALTVLVNSFTRVDYSFSVSRKVFYPSPKVDSAVVTMEPKEVNIPIESKPTERKPFESKPCFKKLVFASFGQRRKTILNSLHGETGFSKKIIAKWLERAEIDPNCRAEELTAEEFANLFWVIYNNFR